MERTALPLPPEVWAATPAAAQALIASLQARIRELEARLGQDSSNSSVQEAAVVNVDETGWRQEQERAWLWTVMAAGLTVFRINRSRGGAAVEGLLGSAFAGVAGSDRWSAYQRFPAERRALCYAHLKRDFQGLVDRGAEAKPIGRWGLAEIERLFALWHRFRAGQRDRQELQRRLIPLQARLGRLLRRGQKSPDWKAAGLCRELTKWWPALWTFARVEGVEPTNDVAERALRPAVLWRKGSFGSNSEAGSQLVERLLTVVASCRQQGRPLLDFLVAAGEAALRGSPPPCLLPAVRRADRLRRTEDDHAVPVPLSDRRWVAVPQPPRRASSTEPMSSSTHPDPAERSAFMRLFYRGWRPTRFGRWVNRFQCWWSGLGLPRRFMAALEVRGRASGRRRANAVVIAGVEGNRYLVSMLGPRSDWVKNVEAAHGDAVIRQGSRRRVHLVLVPPEQRAPILREYVRMAPSGRQHFPLPVGAPLSDFEAIAERYPVYRIDPV